MATTYSIDNADLISDKVAKGTPRPRDCVRGTIIVVTRTMAAHEHGNGSAKVIIPGRYRIIDRKHFRAGYQTAERID